MYAITKLLIFVLAIMQQITLKTMWRFLIRWGDSDTWHNQNWEPVGTVPSNKFERDIIENTFKTLPSANISTFSCFSHS